MMMFIPIYIHKVLSFYDWTPYDEYVNFEKKVQQLITVSAV